MSRIELGPGYLIIDPVEEKKKCKDCLQFDTVPGMKWGICKRRRRSSNHKDPMVTGPNNICWYTNAEKERI